ncbi:MAG: hypothetical protein H6608_08760 [Flavobacteriales bacterium]|nr:hypothetical protein [Flavobacteriales bacterium]
MKQTGKVATWKGYLTDSLLGFSVLLIFPFALLFANVDFSTLATTVQVVTVLAWIIVFYMAYGYTQERKFRQIKTDYNRSLNHKLVRQTLNKLQWKQEAHAEYFDLNVPNQKFILQFVRFYVLVDDGRILINIMYHGGNLGRWPSFCGIRTFLYWKLKDELRKNYPAHNN